MSDSATSRDPAIGADLAIAPRRENRRRQSRLRNGPSTAHAARIDAAEPLPGDAAAGAAAFHIPSLDGIRAAAVILVFGAHAGLDRVLPGNFGVTVFFFLSGYLITSLLRIEHER
ncbi:MAG: hypothetical protein ABR915_05330, partial [Thermoguttaceae bacterium]